MQNPSSVCGNCGESVSSSDVICPHCGVLLAAYASPTGSTTAYAYAYESSDPNADAVPEPAAPITIPDEVEVVSTAPRPLFDTQLTVEDIAKAAESDHGGLVGLVREEEAVTKPIAFDVPDYAKAPSDAAPVPVLDNGDEKMIARAAGRPPTPQKLAQQARSNEPRPATVAEPVIASAEAERSESWLYDLSRSGPAHLPQRAPRERKTRPEPTRTTTLPPGKRGGTDNYPRKLHQEAGYESGSAQLTQPVQTQTSRSSNNTKPGTRKTNEVESLEASRKGCSVLLYFVLFFMWIGVIIGVFTGNFSPGLLIFAVVLSVVAKFLTKPFPIARK